MQHSISTIKIDFAKLLSEDHGHAHGTLTQVNAWLDQCSAEERIRWTLEQMPGPHVLSSSFGIQAAVMLHMVTRIAPYIPVVVVDTGYLFPETYRFIDDLTQRLQLNLLVCRGALSPAWFEARHGRLWEYGLEGIERYNRINKVEPMERALSELSARSWFAGLRRSQSKSRSRLPVLQRKGDRFKVHPIVDWNTRDVHGYLKRHDLPYHPLWEKGYVSVGDTHTTRPLATGMAEEDTRFFGLKRECGLHE